MLYLSTISLAPPDPVFAKHVKRRQALSSTGTAHAPAPPLSCTILHASLPAPNSWLRGAAAAQAASPCRLWVPQSRPKTVHARWRSPGMPTDTADIDAGLLDQSVPATLFNCWRPSFNSLLASGEASNSVLSSCPNSRSVLPSRMNGITAAAVPSCSISHDATCGATSTNHMINDRPASPAPFPKKIRSPPFQGSDNKSEQWTLQHLSTLP